MRLSRSIVLLAGLFGIATVGCVVGTVPAKPASTAAVPPVAPPPPPAPVTPAPPPKVVPATPGRPVAKGWVPLGKREVNFRGRPSSHPDHDVIKVGAHDGRFRAIRLAVKGSPLELFRVRIAFANGEEWEPKNVRHVFRKGTWTRRIDLPGGKRVIRQVDFWYRSLRPKKGKATMQLFGQH